MLVYVFFLYYDDTGSYNDNIGIYTYIAGGALTIPQVWIAKQWNLVIVNLNVIIGYIIYYLNV